MSIRNLCFLGMLNLLICSKVALPKHDAEPLGKLRNNRD
jgi:hypothetical protein